MLNNGDFKVIPKEELEDMYCDKSMSQIEIANEIGVSQQTVSKWMKEFGIEPRIQLGDSVKPSKKKLEDMYVGQSMSQLKIANKIGVLPHTISKWMKECGIEARDRSESTGENARNWKGGITCRKYCYKFNNKFKEAVRKRDDYTCQLCGFEQNGRKLDVHHIHYDKENCYPDVITLCRSCNIRVNGDRDYWEEYFENQLIEKGIIYWSLS